MRYLGIAFIRLYQTLISPFFPSACRFYPSCSEYILQSIRKHGLVTGGWKGLQRLGKCHPFHPGGYDPVDEQCERHTIR